MDLDHKTLWESLDGKGHTLEELAGFGLDTEQIFIYRGFYWAGIQLPGKVCKTFFYFTKEEDSGKYLRAGSR
jgi:hypothetical protein